MRMTVSVRNVVRVPDAWNVASRLLDEPAAGRVMEWGIPSERMAIPTRSAAGPVGMHLRTVPVPRACLLLGAAAGAATAKRSLGT